MNQRIVRVLRNHAADTVYPQTALCDDCLNNKDIDLSRVTQPWVEKGANPSIWFVHSDHPEIACVACGFKPGEDKEFHVLISVAVSARNAEEAENFVARTLERLKTVRENQGTVEQIRAAREIGEDRHLGEIEIRDVVESTGTS